MDEVKKIQIHYLKVNNLETKLTTGAVGGLTPNGLINMDLFIDRIPIPQTVTHEVNNRAVGKVLESNGKIGIIREVHTSLIFDVNVAQAIIDWLNRRISEVKAGTVEPNKEN